MKAIDWSYCRNYLVLFVISLLLSLGIYVAVDSYTETIAGEYIQLERAYNKAQSDFRQAEKDRSLYTQYLADYRRFVSQGLIGEERRLSWVEELEAINKNMALPRLSYAIEARSETELPHVRVRNNNIQIHVSEMNIQAGLLHEGDFIRLLSALENNATGFFSVKSCTLNSSFDRSIQEFNPRNAYLNIDCALDWLTVKVAS